MLPIKPFQSTNQSAHLSANTPKVPIRVPAPRADDFPPAGNIRGQKVTQFPDPGNPHLFLVPPHDNPQPELELDLGRRDATLLTLQEWKGYQDVADLFPDAIYEASDLDTDGPSLVFTGAVGKVRHLGLRGGAYGEYFVNTGADGLDNSLLRESANLITEGGVSTTTSPKGQIPNEIASLSLAAGGHASLNTPLLWRVALGEMAFQIGLTLLNSVVIGLAIGAGIVLTQNANAWAQRWFRERTKQH